MKTFVGLPTARRGCLMRPSCCKIHTRMRGLLTLKRQLTTVAARGGGTHRHLLLVKSYFLSQRLFSKWTWTRARTSRASSAFGFARNGEFSSRMKAAASSLANGDNGERERQTHLSLKRTVVSESSELLLMLKSCQCLFLLLLQ